MRTDGQTDMRKIIEVFSDRASASKSCDFLILCARILINPDKVIKI